MELGKSEAMRVIPFCGIALSLVLACDSEPEDSSVTEELAGTDILATDEALQPDQSIGAGNTTLLYQQDGNLVLYQYGAPVWAAGSLGTPGQFLMQSDCNAVVYSPDGPVWASNSAGRGGSCYARVIEGDWFICSDTTRVFSARGGGDCGGPTECTFAGYVNVTEQVEEHYDTAKPTRYCSTTESPLPGYCTQYCMYVGGLQLGYIDVRAERIKHTIKKGQKQDTCGNIDPQVVVISDTNETLYQCWVLTGTNCADQYWRLQEGPRCQ
jgi:hypothetical protein